MLDGRVYGRALALAVAANFAVFGCAAGGDIASSGASLVMTEAPASSSTTTPDPTPPGDGSSTTETGTETGGDTDEMTGSVMTMEVACGDGMPDPGEECDDGNLENTDDCTNACKLPTCGDTFIHAGFEACDDGNLDDTDACLSTCVAAKCGDGNLHAGIEACDDGNALDGDECSSMCTIPGCGDGVLDMMTEECDDGNAVNTDACTAACKAATCGDGILHDGAEECDDGNLVADDGCEPDCLITQKFTAVGPQINFPAANLDGWNICFSNTYDQFTPPVADILLACNKANLMLACRPVGSPTYTLLAHAPRTAVLTDTGVENTLTVNNGVGWYFNDSYSWGFVKQGETVNRNSCDTLVGDTRLCWHTDAGTLNGGYRCGDNIIGNEPTWERVVLHAD